MKMQRGGLFVCLGLLLLGAMSCRSSPTPAQSPLSVLPTPAMVVAISPPMIPTTSPTTARTAAPTVTSTPRPTATMPPTAMLPTTMAVTLTPLPTVAIRPTPVYTITSVTLPAECYDISPHEPYPPEEFLPCTNFKISPDGRYLGFFFGPDLCGRAIFILDAHSNTQLYRGELGGGFGFEFLPNGKILIATGHCEGGQINLFDPVSRAFGRLGGIGKGPIWNPAQTAFVVTASVYQGTQSAVWGYHVERDFVFLAEPTRWQVDDHALWTPDGEHILYQHRALTYTIGTWAYVFPEARQIIRVNAATGETHSLASDPHYDYHFCGWDYASCDVWQGDWIQVRRQPFTPQSIDFNDDFYRQPAANCLLAGIDCSTPPVLLALNWRTGELIPWEALPAPP